MLSGLLHQYGGNVRKALSAYNAGDPNVRGTVTTWGDGARLGYADSVMRHYAALGGDFGSLLDEVGAEAPSEVANVNVLSSFASLQQSPALAFESHSYHATQNKYDIISEDL
jgi:hypothetical protein